MRSAVIHWGLLLFTFTAAQAGAQGTEAGAEEARKQQKQQETAASSEKSGDPSANTGGESAPPPAQPPADSKPLKDRISFSGEGRFRFMSSTFTTNSGYYGGGQPAADSRWRDETSFPMRIRLNFHGEVVVNLVDFYARLTLNKRWGAYDTTLSPSANPLDRTNSFEASIGHDMSPRFEQAYMTLKIPSVNGTWYIGRLPGLDGPPSRQERSLFPRIFIDSEIDGTLFQWNPSKGPFDSSELPWTKTRLRGEASKPGTAPAAKSSEAKAREKTGFIAGYLKYDERKESRPHDSDAYLGQALLKIGQNTSVIASGLYMDEWHIPNPSRDTSVPDFMTPYTLAGVYADTQLLGFQVYGAYYYSHFKIPRHSWTDAGAVWTYGGGEFPGHMSYAGFNTGDLIRPNHQFCAEYAAGSDAWINPFNYRGYRRKGTVTFAANNYFYNRHDTETVVGFYPFNAGVWDIYYDIYYKSRVRFRSGLMDFRYQKHEGNDGGPSILGSSKYEHMWWPYFEVNISF